ncbi:MAG: DUF494 family protein [Deltaproteobacteria bacterium]|nr:DUF494 family protein [Deltaproteobacteria bacterium]
MFEVMAYMFRRYGLDAGSPERATELFDELLDAGFSAPDVERALTWMRSLASFPRPWRGMMAAPSTSLRVPTCEEALKFTPAARGLLLRLEKGGILDETFRELVYEKALKLDVPEIGVEELCVLVAVLLEAGGLGTGSVCARLLQGEIDRIHH